MENKALENLRLTIQFEDGRSIESSFNNATGTFDIDPSIFEAKHNIARLLKVIDINEENLVHLTYIFDSDYSPRHFYFRLGEALRMEDHVEIITPHFEQKLQHITLLIQSNK